jgi:hypothetical protein
VVLKHEEPKCGPGQVQKLMRQSGSVRRAIFLALRDVAAGGLGVPTGSSSAGHRFTRYPVVSLGAEYLVIGHPTVPTGERLRFESVRAWG